MVVGMFISVLPLLNPHDTTEQSSYIGQTGLGKSTMINTLFASHLIESKGRTEPDISPRQTTEIHGKSQSKLRLPWSWQWADDQSLPKTVLDWSWISSIHPVMAIWSIMTIAGILLLNMYVQLSRLGTSADSQIKDQHSAYLRKELTALRDRHIADTRIHCCLFFINPTGHTLKPVSCKALALGLNWLSDRYCRPKETRRGRQCRPCHCQVWFVDLGREIPIQAEGKLPMP